MISTFIHLMRGQMSTPLDEFGGKCPDMPFWAGDKCPRGHMSVPRKFAIQYLELSRVTVSVSIIT